MRRLSWSKWVFCGVLVGSCLLGGCVKNKPANPGAARATDVDPKLADKNYWLSQPASAEVSGRDFTELWEASEAVARNYLFRIDRRDYRAGLLTTEPMVSKQIFELWRKDAGTGYDTREATIAPIRRTIYFQFTPNADGSYTVSPKVVVERQSKVEPKYREEIDMPASYWYALRRDTVLEGKVAEAIRKKMQG